MEAVVKDLQILQFLLLLLLVTMEEVIGLNRMQMELITLVAVDLVDRMEVAKMEVLVDQV